ncbi:MAG TPA: hypothetical protein PKA21_02910 [Kiritimatiellia bacterium]|nr:hypothetical protein [Kiritimatiellia bacterium]HMP97202.1 hypothetical protein [Kiritimatiellia bacterium]
MRLTEIMADSDLGTLIYIIVVFLWVISNVFAKSRKKKKRGTPVPRAGESSAEQELREFLETIGGQPAEVETAPPPPVRPAPRAARMRERPRTAARVATPPPLRFETPSAPPVDLEEVAREMRAGAPSMAGSFSTTLSSTGSIFKTTGITLPSFKYAFSTSRPRPVVPVLTREQLTEKENLRRLLVGKTLLGPPRAFDPYRFDTEGSKMN